MASDEKPARRFKRLPVVIEEDHNEVIVNTWGFDLQNLSFNLKYKFSLCIYLDLYVDHNKSFCVP